MQRASTANWSDGLRRASVAFSGLVLLLVLTAAPALLLLASERQLYQKWVESEQADLELAANDSGYYLVEGSVVLTEGAAAQSYTIGKTKRRPATSWTSSRRESGSNESTGTAQRSGVFTTGVPNVIQLWPEGETFPEIYGGGITFQSPLPTHNTFRTLCVRLCDGYYWPVSFATTKDGLSDDASVCESSCGSPVRLYYYSNPGGDPEAMRDMRGNRYEKLPTAFLYRTHYSSSCKCQPDPWEEASLAKHRQFATLAKAKKTKLASNGKKKKKKKSSEPDDAAIVTVVSFTSAEEPVGQTATAEDFGSDGMITVIKKKTKNKAGKKPATTVKVTKGKAVKSGLLGSSSTMKFSAGGKSNVFRSKSGSQSYSKQ